MRHEYHPEALAELIEVEEWYQTQLPGLGLEFHEEIERVIGSIKAMPQAAPRWPDVDASMDIRRALLRRFPYALAYFLRENVLVILAVAHTRRRPGYWLHRLPLH